MYIVFSPRAGHYLYRRAAGFFLGRNVTFATQQKQPVTGFFGRQTETNHGTTYCGRLVDRVWFSYKPYTLTGVLKEASSSRHLAPADQNGLSASRHNVYSVREWRQHYMQCSAPGAESPAEKVCAAATFVTFFLILVFLG